MHSHQTFDLEEQLVRKTTPEETKSSNLVNNNLTSLQNNGNISKQTQALLKQYQQSQYCQQNGEYGLEYPEISVNFQNVDDSQFSEAFLSDILQSKFMQNLQSKQVARCYNDPSLHKTLAYMPQPVHSPLTYSLPETSPSSESNSSFNSDTPLIKEEPADFDYFGTLNGFGPFARADSAFTTVPPSSLQLQQKNQQNISRKGGKYIDKDSDEYRSKRLRNNIAVRKSREKANQKKKEIEEKNRMLLRENDKKQKRIESLEEENQLLRTLLYSYGFSPEQLSRGTDVQ